MKLTKAERTRILEGGYKPLHRTDKPDLEPGAVIVVSWTRPRKWVDEEAKHVFAPKPEPQLTLTVTDIVRRTKGGWAIYFHVTDSRHADWYMSKGGGYTRAKREAIDSLATPVDSKTEARLSIEARRTAVERREKDKEAVDREERRQERAFRDRLRETMQSLSPEARAILLADLERRIARELEQAA